METANGSGRDTVRSYDRGHSRGAVQRALLPDAAALPEATGPRI
jgi:hypothetical protein